VPRQPRVEGAGLIHHVTGHSTAEVNAFPDDAAKRGFLTLLARAATTLDWRVFAYCLLSSHYHLLVETELPNLGEGMRRIQGSHAGRLNVRLKRSGPLWRDRFHSKVVETGAYVVQAAVYIDTNPVAAGLCKRAEGWRWSSYRANAGLAEPPFWHCVDRFHEHLGAESAEAPVVYRELVATAVELALAR
jgi:putative transposase